MQLYADLLNHVASVREGFPKEAGTHKRRMHVLPFNVATLRQPTIGDMESKWTRIL